MKKWIFCIMAVAALAACGVKPKNVKPPEGAQDIYPATYPAPSEEEINANRAAAQMRVQNDQQKSQ